MSADSTDQPYCITTCKHGRSGSGDMVRCCMCFHWYHEDCVKSDKSRDAHWWLCHSCRGMSQRLILLETSILTLTNTVQELATVNTELSNDNERLVAEIRKLNSEQKARFEARDNTVCKCKAPSPSKPDLLIGWSIIRDLVSNDDKSLVIKSYGGARTDNIWKIMNNMKTDEYGDVFLQVGSNYSATKKPVQGIVENFDKLIATAKRVSSTGHVTLSSICPRTDDDEAAARGIDINSRVQELADTRGCVLIEHEGTFLCKNGEINTALLLIDGLHLSEAGSKALLHNLVLRQERMSDWGKGCEEKVLLRPGIPHTTSISVTGCPPTLMVVDAHHRQGHHREIDARTSQGTSGSLVKVTDDDLGTNANHSTSRTTVNAMGESNGTNTELSIRTIPTVTNRDGEIWTSPNAVAASLVADIVTNQDTRTNSVATKTMCNVEIMVN